MTYERFRYCYAKCLKFPFGLPGCLLVVSHDRYFMDKIVDHLLFSEEMPVEDFPETIRFWGL